MNIKSSEFKLYLDFSASVRYVGRLLNVGKTCGTYFLSQIMFFCC